MSQPTELDIKREWLNQDVEVRVSREDGQYISRRYRLDEGLLPEINLQEIVDELLDTSEL